LLICGEAKSHCVKSSATDIVEKMKTTNHVPNHVYILEDAMSSVNLGNDPAVKSLNELFQGFSVEFIENMSKEGANITTCSNVYNELQKQKV
jgi:nicotinamidase-related amidase